MSHFFAPLSQWPIASPSRPIVFAGPCSAETPDQVLETAIELKAQGVQALRFGIWKPRTRPGSFEGMGDEALAWIVEAGKKAALPVLTEVATPRHVESALKAGVDMLWIGARTTVNPFLVQELADALQGVQVPVLVKNPVNPDLELWLGAIERMLQTGNQRVAAIHRGFSSYENSTYRNKPNWEIPIELRRRLPGLAMFCDPSHICGNTTLIPHISQVALDLHYDGLMIESHRDPKNAWSDAAQQMTPAQLGEMMRSFEIRLAESGDPVVLSRLEDLRDQIDEIDYELLDLLAARMDVARKIGVYKFHHGITVLQPDRWEEILQTRSRKGVEKEMSAGFIQRLYAVIHDESISQQTVRMSEEKSTKNSSLNPSTK